uniref:Uncharacterized protein n=1 Tax=Arundo donax TaxID=35708 RepID=A0A0A9HUL5_ARUDO
MCTLNSQNYKISFIAGNKLTAGANNRFRVLFKNTPTTRIHRFNWHIIQDPSPSPQASVLFLHTPASVIVISSQETSHVHQTN